MAGSEVNVPASSRARAPLRERLVLWVRLCRPKFHLVGVLPFILGNVLALSYGHLVNWMVMVLGSLAVVLLMLVTYLLGEYFDYEVDSLNVEFNSFSGGTRVLQTGKISKRAVLVVALLLIVPIVAIGLILQFHYRCGPLTIFLGVFGLCAGVFYSAKPVQWAYHGLGELFIAICYGWLTVNTGYYLQTGQFDFPGTLVSIPIMSSVAAVIIINEFPDYNADRTAGKRNLVVSLGKATSGAIYQILLLITLLSSFFASIYPFSFPYYFLPLITVPIVLRMLLQSSRIDKRGPAGLESLCAQTIVLNLLVILLPLCALLYETIRRARFFEML